MPKKKQATAQPKDEPKEKRAYIQAPIVTDPGIKCPHCGHLYGHHVTNTFRNGNRRYKCGACNMPFVVRRLA